MSNLSFRTDSSASEDLNSHRLEFVRVNLHPQEISPKKLGGTGTIMHEYDLERSCHSIPLVTPTSTLERILEKIYQDISLRHTNKQ